MSILDGENFADIINEAYWKRIETETLFVPINKLEIERDENQNLILTTYSHENATSNAKNTLLGSVRNNDDSLKIVLSFSEDEIHMSGINSFNKNVTIDQENFQRIEKTSVHMIQYIPKKKQKAHYTIEWIDNLDQNFYFYPDTIQTEEIHTNNIKLLSFNDSVELKSSSKKGNSSRACIYLNINGQELYIGKCTKQNKLHDMGSGFILYKGTPSEKKRRKIRDCLSYALDRYIVYLGYTTYNDNWKWLDFKAIRGYSINNAVYNIHTLPPTPLCPKNVNGIDNKLIMRLVNALHKHYDELELQHILWLYWHARCAPIHMAAVHYGGAIEFLIDNYIKIHPTKFKKSILEKDNWATLFNKAKEILDTFNIDQTTKEILKNKISNLNQMPYTLKEKQFLDLLQIKFTNIEKSAWQQRNHAAHGKKTESDKTISLIREVKILRNILNRFILQITQGSDKYIDYYSIGHPRRNLTEAIPNTK
ncbi:MAG: hypothetical protein JW802_07190 [Campylobacterales bacterium]|nr:hypothetical protein [Campylobacterales bacterium]